MNYNPTTRKFTVTTALTDFSEVQTWTIVMELNDGINIPVTSYLFRVTITNTAPVY